MVFASVHPLLSFVTCSSCNECCYNDALDPILCPSFVCCGVFFSIRTTQKRDHFLKSLQRRLKWHLSICFGGIRWKSQQTEMSLLHNQYPINYPSGFQCTFQLLIKKKLKFMAMFSLNANDGPWQIVSVCYKYTAPYYWQLDRQIQSDLDFIISLYIAKKLAGREV